MTQLKATGICKAYGKQQVLENLDLTIESGKIYGLIGRNGVGKTTLLSILTGQTTHDSGTVTYNGQPVWDNKAVLKDICFSREISTSIGRGKNAQKMKYYLQAAKIFYQHWDEDYAQRLVKHFNLNPKKQIAQMSKGQVSLVSIIIGLASRCPLTILDEPVAGLDVVAREDFYNLLLEDYQETERTFIISTHIIEEAANIFEEVIFLDGGRVLEKAVTEELIVQFHSVSGHEDVVRQACNGLELLSTQQLGRQMVCVVRGDGAKLREVERQDVDITPMNLQKVFVALCGRSGEGLE